MKGPRIIFFILPKTHLLDLAGPDQVFLEAMDHETGITMEYCSWKSPVITSSGLEFSNTKDFRDVIAGRGDYIIIPGADMKMLTGKTIPGEKEVGRWLKEAHAAGAFICSICTGAFFLARTGLLDSIRCTTHWKYTHSLKELYPAAKVQQDILFTEDNRVLTSAGVTAGIDLALHIVEKTRDANTAFKVARELVIYRRRNGNESQQSVFMKYRNHIHSGVHKVQDHIQENLAGKINLLDLSDIACMSLRSLSRIFKKETGITVHEYITIIRRDLLESIKANPEISRRQMAELCGLKSERQVARLLKQA